MQHVVVSRLDADAYILTAVEAHVFHSNGLLCPVKISSHQEWIRAAWPFGVSNLTFEHGLDGRGKLVAVNDNHAGTVNWCLSVRRGL